MIAYYVPFTRELAKTNQTGTVLASADWELAYEETNAMFGKLNEYLIHFLKKHGFKGEISPKSATFDQKLLKSDWSHLHFAYAAGVGTFGINNMLITRYGCCGRYSTILQKNAEVYTDFGSSYVDENGEDANSVGSEVCGKYVTQSP